MWGAASPGGYWGGVTVALGGLWGPQKRGRGLGCVEGLLWASGIGGEGMLWGPTVTYPLGLGLWALSPGSGGCLQPGGGGGWGT